MIQTVRKAWGIPELRKKITFTLLILLIYRIGSAIPVPFIDGRQLEAVKKASCAIADVLLDEEIMTASVYSGGAQVSSETVGGWSRSYRAPTLSAAEVENIRSRKADALVMYLGGLQAFAPLFKVRSYQCLHG